MISVDLDLFAVEKGTDNPQTEDSKDQQTFFMQKFLLMPYFQA